MKEILAMVSTGHRPGYANEHAAGLDLRIHCEKPVTLKTGDHYFAHTGVHVAIPEGYFGLVVIRSGLGKKGLMAANGIGIIDCDYRGEIRVPLYYHGEDAITLEDGERICQMILVPYMQPEIQYVEELSETDRGSEGFGSSGRF